MTENKTKDKFLGLFVFITVSVGWGLLLNIFPFGSLVHEGTHWLVATAFGVHVSYVSLSHIVIDLIPNSTVNTIVFLSGGLGQSFVASIAFWLVALTEKKFFSKNESLKYISSSFQLAILIIIFQGIFGAMLEGFITEFYVAEIYNPMLLLTTFSSSIVLSVLVKLKFNSIGFSKTFMLRNENLKNAEVKNLIVDRKENN